MKQKKRMVNRCTPKPIFNLCSDKKGQITIFIIVGIVLVFAFASILYFTRVNTTASIQSAEEPLLVTVPVEFQPIQAYTESCLSKVGKQGLIVLGQHGGYIYPNLVGKYSSSKSTESEGLLIDESQVPYWYYNAEPNAGSKVAYASLKPKLYLKDDPAMSIEAQLARYVKEQLDSCLNNYSALTTIKTEFPDGGQKEVVAHVGETGVVFTLTMDVKATQGSSQSDLQQFSVKVPLHFKHYYEVADKVAFAEQNFSFLERQGMELISIYGSKDPEGLAPISDIGFEQVAVLSWDVKDLQQKVQGMLTSYVPMLRFLGSSNFYHATFPEDKLLAQQVVDNMILTLDGAEDVNVNFDYLGWTPYFKVNSDGNKVKPESIHVHFLTFDYNQQRYDTHYDVSYPVLVTVKDSLAFDGEGYQFVIALESNIRNNKPAVANEPWKVDIPLPVDSLTCHQNTWAAGDLKTIVVDSYTKQPLEEVKVTFSVPNQEDCDIGVTDMEGEIFSKYPAVYGGSMGFMKPEYLTNFYPINTYKYQNKSALIGYAVEGATSPKVIELDKIKNINITVKKKELKECITPVVCKYTYGASILFVPYKDVYCKKGNEKSSDKEQVGGGVLSTGVWADYTVGPFCYFNNGSSLFDLVDLSQPVYSYQVNSSLSKFHDFYFVDKEVPLSENETALITLEKVGSLHSQTKDDGFSAVIKAQGNNPDEVQLVPGVYKLSGSITLKRKVIVPEERRCSYMDYISGVTLYGTQWDTEKCQNINRVENDKQMIGGIDFANNDTYITITPEQLYGSNEITLYVLAQTLLPEEGALSAPLQIPSIEINCEGAECVSNVGCLVTTCHKKDIVINGVVSESLAVFGELGRLSATSEIYPALQPTFS